MTSNLCIFLVTASIFSVNIVAGYDIVTAANINQYCFNYRWVAWDSSNLYDCSNRTNVPCIWPQLNTTDIPNSTKLWEDWKNENTPELPDYLCSDTSGNSCVKYTFWFDNNIVNTSSFCGKVIEDGVVPVTTGCYRQTVNGFVIEMCVCPPQFNSEPCNSSDIKYSSSLLTALAALFAFTKFAQ